MKDMDPLLAATGNTGGYRPLVHNGRTFKFHQWTDELRARFLQWVKAYAVKELRDLRDAGVYSPSEYNQAFAVLTRDILNGEYSFGRPTINSIVATQIGSHALVRTLLNDNYIPDEDIAALLRERLPEVEAILSELDGEVERVEGDEGKA